MCCCDVQFGFLEQKRDTWNRIALMRANEMSGMAFFKLLVNDSFQSYEIKMAPHSNLSARFSRPSIDLSDDER
jgi:hypothetical protein